MTRWPIPLLFCLSCELPERGDFLVGRSCVRTGPSGCDEEQACLPHAFAGGAMSDFRCRDTLSFALRDGREPPIAFCDPELGLDCPDGIECAAGRIRDDSGLRRLACKRPDDTFGPPTDAGS